MIRYRLDELGWHEFEWLCQSLLKAELGPGVESWGGRGDHGVDAYCGQSLNFPARHISTDGPFVFQIKFVEGANAPGASFEGPLKDAARKEAARIKSRVQHGLWKHPREYVLATNARPSPDVRDGVLNSMVDAVSGTHLHLLSGNDLCDYLDKHPNLRKSFPQILGLRDLTEIIESVVSREILELSRTAIELAQEVLPVFVPTSAYFKTWKVLNDHHFAVLEGPPEMGKSAIAWVIAIAQVSLGWQAVYCRGPEEFFGSYKPDSKQIFVADDAFGRGEYDPARASKWERELGLALHKVDPKHWLIWTSRKHILEMALNAMDLQEAAKNFPSPAAVVVDASQLSQREKAIMLYRHAKSANLVTSAKELVRTNARAIVNDPCFTPERIRRFAKEVLPKLATLQTGASNLTEETQKAIREAIRNPTDRMRKTFRHLPDSHKWLLTALLIAGDNPNLQNVERHYLALCGGGEHQPFGEVFRELTESFVKNTEIKTSSHKRPVLWTHPSYRDLLVEELSMNSELHARFLANMTLHGIKLAISDVGGATGNRRFPFMTTEASWAQLAARCSEFIIDDNKAEFSDLLITLTKAAKGEEGGSAESHLIAILSNVIDRVRKNWDESGDWLSSYELNAYARATLLIVPLPTMPNLEATWKNFVQTLQFTLTDYEDTKYLQPDDLYRSLRTVNSMQENQPRFLRQVRFPESFLGLFGRLLQLVSEEVADESASYGWGDLRDEAPRFDTIADLVDALSAVAPSLGDAATRLVNDLHAKSTRLEERAAEEEAQTPDPPDQDYEYPASSAFDVEGLFSDL